ncbi:MAG: hypothetical protein U0165_18985 [Polyangiaceae bacterium]
MLSLDDLQWADHASLQHLTQSLAHISGPVLVLALTRSSRRDELREVFKSVGVDEIEVGALDNDACNQLIDLTLNLPIKRGRRDDMIRKSEGNPFFLEELLSIHASGRGGESPDSLVALIQGRLATLQPADRRVLRAASIFGMSAEIAAVGELLSDATGIDESARRLSDAGIVELQLGAFDPEHPPTLPGAPPRVERLSFRSTLLRDAVHNTLTDSDRALGHRVAARWLSDRGGVDPLTMAEHCELGGDNAQAASWLHFAIDQALQGGDLGGALSLIERAFRCGASGAQLGVLHLQKAEAHDWRGEFAACEESARAAMSMLEAGSDAWFRAAAELAMACGKRGRLQEFAADASVILDQCATRPCQSALIALARMVSPLTFARSAVAAATRHVRAHSFNNWVSTTCAWQVLVPPRARLSCDERGRQRSLG